MSGIRANVDNMRAGRLISLMIRLQARGRLTAAEMARELEVSVRTIYRDIDQLSAAGIPVVAERGCQGGFKLIDGFRTQLGPLTETEAESLFLAALPGAAAELGLADQMESARSKVMKALPGGSRAQQFGARFHLDTKAWFRASEPVAMLPTIADAVRRSQWLKIRYSTDRHATMRRVGPGRTRAQGRHLVPDCPAGRDFSNLSGGPSFRSRSAGRSVLASARLQLTCLLGTLVQRLRGWQLPDPCDGAPVTPRAFSLGSSRPLRRGIRCQDGRRAGSTGLGALYDPLGECRVRCSGAPALGPQCGGHIPAVLENAVEKDAASDFAKLRESFFQRSINVRLSCRSPICAVGDS